MPWQHSELRLPIFGPGRRRQNCPCRSSWWAWTARGSLFGWFWSLEFPSSSGCHARSGAGSRTFTCPFRTWFTSTPCWTETSNQSRTRYFCKTTLYYCLLPSSASIVRPGFRIPAFWLSTCPKACPRWPACPCRIDSWVRCPYFFYLFILNYYILREFQCKLI